MLCRRMYYTGFLERNKIIERHFGSIHIRRYVNISVHTYFIQNSKRMSKSFSAKRVYVSVMQKFFFSQNYCFLHI